MRGLGDWARALVSRGDEQEPPVGLDHRSLAAFRIAFGVVLLTNLATRSYGGRFEAHYTETGVLPLGLVPRFGPRWSFLDAFSDPVAAKVGFALIAAVYLAYTLGLFTRLMQVLVVACLLSLYHRNPLLDDGSDWVMRFFAIWTAFLPLGDRFSLDLRWRKKLRRGGLHHSFAMWAFIANLGVSYFLNSYQKDGISWGEGTALRYVMWDPWTVSPVAASMRRALGDGPIWVLTKLPLLVEYILAAGVLFAPFSRHIKRVVVVLMLGLHLAFASFLFIGSFSFLYVSCAFMFIPSEDWERLGIEDAPQRRPRPLWRRGLVTGLAVVWALFAGYELVQRNYRVSRPVKAVAALVAPWLEPVHVFLMVPQEWFMFRAPSPYQEVTVVEAVAADGTRYDPFRPGPFDLHRPIHESAHVGKYWVSYLVRLSRPGFDRYRSALARYLEARGATAVTIHLLKLDAPSTRDGEPTKIRDEIVFTTANRR
ncbi:MAG: hypothetical protein R3B72_46730 [Polyangiaceae bacterium]